MDRATAETILDRIKAWEAVFGDLHDISVGLAEGEQRRLRGAIGELALDIHEGIVRPIVAEHPDLDPTRASRKGSDLSRAERTTN